MNSKIIIVACFLIVLLAFAAAEDRPECNEVCNNGGSIEGCCRGFGYKDGGSCNGGKATCNGKPWTK